MEHTDEQSNKRKERDDQHYTMLFDELARKRQKRRGNKDEPEPPSMIEKLCQEGGELWLSGLPTEDTYQTQYEGKQFSMQISCFAESPTQKKSGNSNGILLPKAFQSKINMDARNMREVVRRQMLDNIQLIAISLLLSLIHI